MHTENPDHAAVKPRHSVRIDAAEALRLLGEVSLGRLVFTRHALPTIRPVNHVLHDGELVIRTHEGAALTSRARETDGRGVVVAYEADSIDPVTHLGWSVVVTGYALPVTDPDELSYFRSVLSPWVDGTMDHTFRIRPDLVTGVRLCPPPGE
ncbi:pyridoxamine 5'-phosphate oxidase family protein [Streptomyces sp. NPDC052051]|uniref:pyridoxamine 5'-phosphate oxidase family protein n=1 Tax=Streptomyces sp. NPDC052051 TaxID=3154649 RepID=UPI003433772C